jgi:hypothetical protein
VVEAHDRVRSRSATAVDFERLTAVAQSSAFSRTCSVVQGEVTASGAILPVSYSGARPPPPSLPHGSPCVYSLPNTSPLKRLALLVGGVRGSSWSRTALRACSQGRSRRSKRASKRHLVLLSGRCFFPCTSLSTRGFLGNSTLGSQLRPRLRAGRRVDCSLGPMPLPRRGPNRPLRLCGWRAGTGQERGICCLTLG